MKHENARGLLNRSCSFMLAGVAAFAIGACNQSGTRVASAPPAAAVEEPGTPKPLEELGEFLAYPEELATIPVNDIVKSLRYNAAAMKLGRTVYETNCASCHGEDLKGLKAAHTPNLTDKIWRFSGDDLASGGVTMFPSDVEWTVRYGVRADNQRTKGFDVDMLAFDPQYRNKRDTEDFGDIRTLTDPEIDEVVEFVLKLSGQQNNAAMAARGEVLFQDNAKGNCFDCHGEDATGILAFGSTDLTRKDLYLYGSDRATIKESIVKGRFGTMPSFGGKLKEEELRAVSVYIFARAAK